MIVSSTRIGILKIYLRIVFCSLVDLTKCVGRIIKTCRSPDTCLLAKLSKVSFPLVLGIWLATSFNAASNYSNVIGWFSTDATALD